MSTARAFGVTKGLLEQEFEQLFHEHYPLVYRTAYSVTGKAEDAEDVVQTIFLRLYRRRDGAAGFKKNPKAYLYRAAVNEAISTVRLRRRHILTGDESEFDRPVESDRPANDTALQKQFLEALAKLNPKAVEILILRYEHSYSDAEIAEMLGTSRASIAVQLHRARARLKKFMGDKQ